MASTLDRFTVEDPQTKFRRVVEVKSKVKPGPANTFARLFLRVLDILNL